VTDTDTAGRPDYNMPLSRRRADAVRGAVLDAGAPRARVLARGYGETALAVETPDGVREPGNRRVEVVIRFE